jgi:hypothetical protein
VAQQDVRQHVAGLIHAALAAQVRLGRAAAAAAGRKALAVATLEQAAWGGREGKTRECGDVVASQEHVAVGAWA